MRFALLFAFLCNVAALTATGFNIWIVINALILIYAYINYRN